MKTTVPIRLYPTPEQAALLMAHCQEYISAVNVLVRALDADILPAGASTKDFTAALPSAVKNQALRDARSVWKRSCDLGRIPVLRKPLCQWNNQNWHAEGEALLLPICQDGKVRQITIRCVSVAPEGAPGLLRITHKCGKWIAESAFTLPSPAPTNGERVMGVDLGVKIPAVVHVIGKGTRYCGHGRYQRVIRRFFSARLASTSSTRAKSAPYASPTAKNAAGCVTSTTNSLGRLSPMPRRRTWASFAWRNSLASVSARHAQAVGPRRPRPAKTTA